jgi:hypothetical protein
MAKKSKRPGPAAVLGGMVAGFDQQVFRTTPPAHELVHHARPDDPVPAKDGGMLVIGIPGISVIDGSKDVGVDVAGDGPGDGTQGRETPQAGSSPAPDARR